MTETKASQIFFFPYTISKLNVLKAYFRTIDKIPEFDTLYQKYKNLISRSWLWIVSPSLNDADYESGLCVICKQRN